MKNDQSKQLTPSQAARLLGLSQQRVNVLVRKGRIPSKPVGCHRMIRRSDLDKFAAMKRPSGWSGKNAKRSITD